MPKNLSIAGFPVALSLVNDFALTADGDLMIGPDGDLERATDLTALLQTVLFRLKTHRGDAYYIPDCGASLDEMVGQPLSQETADTAEARITYALSHDGLFQPEDVTFVSSPTEDGAGILIQVTLDLTSFVDASQRSLSFPITLDLQEGLLV